MPNANIYLPNGMYVRFSDEPNKSKLVQQLLKDHWAKTDAANKE